MDISRAIVVAKIRGKYSIGLRIEMISMKPGDGVLAALPVTPPGARGTINSVDDAGQLSVRWDSGSNLSVIVGVDEFKILTTYEMRVEQLESLGLTTSDAQGAADVEEMQGTLQENIDAHLMEYGTDAENGMTH